MNEIKVTGLSFKEGSSPAPAPVSKMKQPADKDEVTQISAKLHPEHDKDLKEMIKRIPKRDRSGIYRAAVQKYLKEYLGQL